MKCYLLQNKRYSRENRRRNKEW